MPEFPLLRGLGLLIVGAAGLGLLAHAVRLPLILGYIAAGLLFGPVFGITPVSHFTELISHLGVALLLFLVGLEMSLDAVRGVGRAALSAGTLQVLATMGVALGVLLLLGHSLPAAAVLGLSAAFSSTVVAVKLLERDRELATTHGRVAVGILLLQDLVAVVALTLMAGFDRGVDAGLGTFLRGLVAAAAGMVALGATAVVAARYFLPRVFTWVADAADAVLIWALCWCFLFIAGAEVLGLSQEVGAFIAGLSLAELPQAQDLRRRVQPLASVFLAVFFVSLGVTMDPAAAFAAWPTVLALTLTALLIKPIVIATALTRVGLDGRSAFFAALALAQTSEFSVIVGALAVSATLLDPSLLSPIGAVAILTMAVSALVLGWRDRLLSRFAGPLGLELRDGAGEQDDRIEDHIIVIGMNALGRRVLTALREAGERVIAIDTDTRKLQGLDCQTVIGTADHPDVLAEASFPTARLVVSALQIEDANNLLAFRCRRAGVPSSIHAFDMSVVDDLREHGATHLIISKADGTRQLAAELRRAGLIG